MKKQQGWVPVAGSLPLLFALACADCVSAPYKTNQPDTSRPHHRPDAADPEYFAPGGADTNLE